MKTLILCDCQADFVTGTMSVKKKGKEAIEKIKLWINRNKDDIDKVLFRVVINNPQSPEFKVNGGEYPRHCIVWTPGVCIEPTLLKLLWRLNIPYFVFNNWYALKDSYINPTNEIVIAGMNGNTSIKKAVEMFWNIRETYVLWPGIWFPKHDETLFKWIREHTQGIFELPKRDVKKDLFVQRIK